jgi:hypothetical protein
MARHGPRDVDQNESATTLPRVVAELHDPTIDVLALDFRGREPHSKAREFKQLRFGPLGQIPAIRLILPEIVNHPLEQPHRLRRRGLVPFFIRLALEQRGQREAGVRLDAALRILFQNAFQESFRRARSQPGYFPAKIPYSGIANVVFQNNLGRLFDGGTVRSVKDDSNRGMHGERRFWILVDQLQELSRVTRAVGFRDHAAHWWKVLGKARSVPITDAPVNSIVIHRRAHGHVQAGQRPGLCVHGNVELGFPANKAHIHSAVFRTIKVDIDNLDWKCVSRLFGIEFREGYVSVDLAFEHMSPALDIHPEVQLPLGIHRDADMPRVQSIHRLPPNQFD